MEQIENEAVNTEAEVDTTLEANATEHDSEGTSAEDAPTSDGKTLSDEEYQEYRKLKRLSEKSTKETGEESNQKQEVSNSADVEELIFSNAGITSDAAKEAAKKLVKLGEASSLMEAVKDDFVAAKEANAAADTTRKTATPPSSSRTPSTKKDTVEHWVDREGLPENRELRYKVIEARRNKRGGNSMFGSPRNVIIK